MKIMIIEDEETIRTEISSILQRYGYETQAPDSFDHIVEDILEAKPHLVLLDLNLPVYDGYYICRELRRQSDIPVIIVTSRNSEMDELMSMNLGADDFITKPYNTQILLARITSVMKRSYQHESTEEIGDGTITLDLARGTVRHGTQEAELSKNELRILHELLSNKGSILSRDDLMESLWQSNEFIDDNTLTVNINRLRKKLDSIGVSGYIQTRRGLGYQI